MIMLAMIFVCSQGELVDMTSVPKQESPFILVSSEECFPPSLQTQDMCEVTSHTDRNDSYQNNEQM